MDNTPKLENIIAIGKEILAEQNLDQVLKTSIDKLIELSGAERGFIVLFNDRGESIFQTARNLKKSDIDRPEFEISKSIINLAKTSKDPIFLKDAMEEPSLNKSQSVGTLKILSVICLPFLHQDKVFAVVYLDNRTVLGAFTQETFNIVENFADFISLAAHNALERKALQERQFDLEKQLRNRYDFKEIIGNSPQMMQVMEMISQVAESDASVLIDGETGTGKELVARAIHYNSSRRDNQLISINCGAFPDNLLESEFFGHEKGAFTGASKRHRGKFEQADGGTLFLDEIHTMSPALQVKLLRVLQSGEFTSLGGETTRTCDVRIVSASKSDLKQLVSKNKFREDLFYRINVILIKMPALRKRKDDILLLAEYFLSNAFKKLKKPATELSDEVKEILTNYSFPGNVRELENIIERAAILSHGKIIEANLLPEEIINNKNTLSPLPQDNNLSFKEAKDKLITDFERQYLLQVLDQSNGVITKAAEIAGMHIKNFREKIIKYNIRPKKEFSS